MRQDSEKLGEVLGKWNRETDRTRNTVGERFTARSRGSPGQKPPVPDGGKPGQTRTSSPGTPLLPGLSSLEITSPHLFSSPHFFSSQAGVSQSLRQRAAVADPAPVPKALFSDFPVSQGCLAWALLWPPPRYTLVSLSLALIHAPLSHVHLCCEIFPARHRDPHLQQVPGRPAPGQASVW